MFKPILFKLVVKETFLIFVYFLYNIYFYIYFMSAVFNENDL